MSKTLSFKILLGITGLMSLAGLYGVIPVSYNTFTGENPCPMIGVVPACYLVTIGYFLMFLASVRRNKAMFFIGWTPVFLLAAVGTIFELCGIDTCPKSESNVPMCYYSFGFALTIGLVFFAWMKLSGSEGGSPGE